MKKILAFLLFSAILLATLCSCANVKTNEELYKAAVTDSITIEQDEIMDVASLRAGSSDVTWDGSGRVLMYTYHKYPSSYIAGSDYTLVYGEIWTVTDKETLAWYNKNKNGVTDWQLRLSQFVGVPTSSSYTHISGMWVSPTDTFRPAYNSDPTDTQVLTQLPDNVSEEYRRWFNDNIAWSYFESAYPWTRLGYTYDWADSGSEFGASEFVVKKDATVEVVFTDTVEQFIDRLESAA